ncbi:hypothetical protein D3C76_839090 [compost metagenome]
MGIEVLDIRSLDAGLSQGRHHGAASAVSILRAGGKVIGIGAGAIPHQLHYGGGAPGQGVFQGLNHQDPGPFAHHKPVAVDIERAGGRLGIIGIGGRQGAGGGKPAQTDAIYGGFGPATDGDVCLTAANEAGGVTNGLHPGGAGRDRRPERPLEAEVDGDMACRHVDQERGDGEGGQATRAPLIRGTHGLDDGGEATDARGDDGGGAFLLSRCLGDPVGLRQGLLGRGNGKQDEAIHLLLLLGRHHGIGVKPGQGILGQGRHHGAHLGGQPFGEDLRQAAQAGLARQQSLPHGFHPISKRGHRSHSRYHDTMCVHDSDSCFEGLSPLITPLAWHRRCFMPSPAAGPGTNLWREGEISWPVRLSTSMGSTSSPVWASFSWMLAPSGARWLLPQVSSAISTALRSWPRGVSAY